MREMKKGFTLAEVLITLAIIGVVAAMTIPTLMANYQKTQYIAGLKKAYAEVTEALRLMANDHGCPDNLKCTSIFKNGDNATLGNEFKKYFKLAKDCGTTYNSNDESTKCFSDSISDNYDGTASRYNPNNYNYYNFITADGLSISLYSYDCEQNYTMSGETNLNISKVCGGINIDVNGMKGPNNYGRDIFAFYITNGKGPALYPMGGSEFVGNGEGGDWLNSSGEPIFCYDQSPYGWACAGRIMEQGWQMKY